ncbi:Heparan-sulfate 6-O-sulfotransferase [Caenorhabditis elegans]|uniref:Heparan-sulfate 6-O-sulfotransferase n=1 Tax=Caenorhabditis elegans TaxID=6239 RepID=G5EFN7_CAEEL|nr:Heparan-sulfate 6-O-sulfotransferase [Caenorhabditis elegans]AAL91661.1 heparan 6-O sulfotransferase HST-6 [Caenorhabditis elegans]CCD70385.1 Heparan-sulfate 6-O-sulfotransferase [Caenorhabditis elegans]|eukprot:NP_508895.2 Heparan-sulfate 6-O-sulfotransferase [Caenorhabditis elegans]
MKKIGMCSIRGWKGVLGKNLFVFVAILFAASIVYFYIDFPLKVNMRTLEDGFHDDDFYNYEDIVQREDTALRFNKTSNDVIVFVHIQKTAGTTFEKFLVRYQQNLPCKCQAHKKRCNCGRRSSNETWLFSRYSTGWVCGLHADFTELVVNSCVQKVLDKQAGHKKKRNYFYTTFLRNPTDRFISEFRHVQRGATWISSKHVCNGKPASVNDLPTCFDPRIGWEGVSLEEFISCPYNLAFNRQTRMLSNLSLVGCYEHMRKPSYEQDKIMIESAKENLRKMSFFGIKEQMDDSQFYFENTFDMQFTRKMSVWGKSKSNDTVLSESQLAYIRNVNKLDWELYEYAVQLFDERVSQLRRKRRIRR